MDARRRTVYTCRVIEVRPTPPTPELALRDVRVVHDEQHPDYQPLDTLDLPSMGLSHLLSPGDDVIFVSQTSPGRNVSLLHQALTGPQDSGGIGRPAVKSSETSVADAAQLPGSSDSSVADLQPMDSLERVLNCLLYTSDAADE